MHWITKVINVMFPIQIDDYVHLFSLVTSLLFQACLGFITKKDKSITIMELTKFKLFYCHVVHSNELGNFI